MQLSFQQGPSEVKVSIFKQPLLGSVKVTEVFKVVRRASYFIAAVYVHLNLIY